MATSSDWTLALLCIAFRHGLNLMLQKALVGWDYGLSLDKLISLAVSLDHMEQVCGPCALSSSHPISQGSSPSCTPLLSMHSRYSLLALRHFQAKELKDRLPDLPDFQWLSSATNAKRAFALIVEWPTMNCLTITHASVNAGKETVTSGRALHHTR